MSYKDGMKRVVAEIYIYIYIGILALMYRVIANGPEDWGSIPGQVILNGT